MRKYIVWLLLVLYTLVMCLVYIPKIQEKYESPEQQAYTKAEEEQRMYSVKREKLGEENQAYLNMQQNQEEPKKQTKEEPQQDRQEDTDSDNFLNNLPYRMSQFMLIVMIGFTVFVIIYEIRERW